MGNANTQDVTETLIDKLIQTKTNEEFINDMRNKIWM
jgi:transcription termination factor Rho